MKEEIAILTLLFLLGAFIFSIVTPMLSPGDPEGGPFEFKDDPESGRSEASAPDLASSKQNEKEPVNDVLAGTNKTVYGGSGK